MAGTLLHITLAEQSLNEANLSTDTKIHLKQNIQDFRLGSVLVDIPYYENLWLTGVRMFLGFGPKFDNIGGKIHVRSPVGLSLALLDYADTPASRAMALGSLTHFAADIVFHPEIEAKVIEANPQNPHDLHKKIEDQMDLHVHYDLLGHSGMGTLYTGRMLFLLPNKDWAKHFSKAIWQVHKENISPTKLKRWLTELRTFGLACSKPMPWLKTLAHDDPKLAKLSHNLAQQAIKLSANYMEIGQNYLDKKIDKKEFLKLIPDRSMTDGGEALPGL